MENMTVVAWHDLNLIANLQVLPVKAQRPLSTPLGTCDVQSKYNACSRPHNILSSAQCAATAPATAADIVAVCDVSTRSEINCTL